MMLRSKFVLASAVALATIVAAPAAHALDLAAVGVLNLPNQSTDPEVDLDGKLGFGFGGLATFGIAPMVGLQVGALYVPSKYEVAGTTVTSDALNIPLAVRVSPIDLLSVGVGGYYTASMETNGTSDLGLLGSAAVKFPLAPLLGIVVDARYLFGIKDLAESDAASTKTRDIQVLVGLNFGI